MKNRKPVVNILAFLAFSAMLVAAQMQMPSSETKPDKSSATPKTLTGIVSDSMCGAHHMAKDKSPARKSVSIPMGQPAEQVRVLRELLGGKGLARLQRAIGRFLEKRKRAQPS